MVSVRCDACSTRIQLLKSRKFYTISNWTRHMKVCQKFHKAEGSKQETLATFLSPEPASSSSGNISDLSGEPGALSHDSSLSEVGIDDESGTSAAEFEAANHSTQPSPQIQPKRCSASHHKEVVADLQNSTVVDWSRAARDKKKLENVGCFDSQSRITDYYSVIDDIDRLTHENQKLSFLLQQVATEEQSSNMSLPTILKQIVSNAEKNAGKLPAGRRHSKVVKKFATSLFIYTGPAAYSFLQHNLHYALPSLRTIQRAVCSEYKTINEGEFRFDDLVDHLSQHKAPNVITIGEDATRVIARVEYDSETNRCVGFVLPVNEQGLPMVDSFLAVSFEGMEAMFSKNSMARYAYVYIAQPLCENSPSFCLACFGTDNKFTAKDVLLRWEHILKECKKRGISVLSIGGDGDSRLMKAMKSCSHLFGTQDELPFPTPSLKFSGVPKEWRSWFLIDASSLALVQDTVHIAVKLKSRLVKPSSLLPMGEYVAGIHHLRMLQASHGKDEHGLRERDIDHKDKQNFSAVLNIIRACPLLDNIPDAPATKQYVEVIQCVVDAFLDKDMDPLVCVEKIWYALIFLRYWRQWIILHPLYTLQRNFITLNAYLCIELNAHSIVSFLMTIRDHFIDDSSYFCPWLLGSQNCEKMFRSARSMTTVFSTIINFGMLGLLRRLHRLQIQSHLQALSEETGIVYPQILKNQCENQKSKHRKPSLNSLTNVQIYEAIVRANTAAKARVECLGMVDLLKKCKVWSSIPASVSVPSDEEDDENDDDDEDSESVETVESIGRDLLDSVIQETSIECPTNIEADVNALKAGNMIDSEMEHKLSSLKKCLPKFKKVNSESIPMYESPSSHIDSYSPFVKVTLGTGVQIFIRKTTVLWLFQEGERVSSDRLFRVRASQPFCSETTRYAKQKKSDCEVSMPVVETDVKLGEICAFVQRGNWSIGKVLQFSKYKKNGVSAQQYKGCSAAVSSDDIGVLCSWFSQVKDSADVFQICDCKTTAHKYFPISCYLCSIPSDCLQVIETSHCQSKSFMENTSSHKIIATAKKIRLTQECQAFIVDCLHSTMKLKPLIDHTVINLETEKEKALPKWTMVGKTVLYESDRAALLDDKEWINDNHISSAQILLKQHFPQLGGLDFTLKQETGSVKTLPPNSLQVIHVDGNHWAAASTVNCKKEDVVVYDSIFSSVNSKTKIILAQLLRTNKPAFSVRVANVAKQSGSSACGLFAIAYITDIAFGRDPEQHVFNQGELRRHLYKCIEQQKMEPFPISREKRVSGICKPVQVNVHCYCRCPDYGVKMVLCDGVCGERFHVKCIEHFDSNRKWYCSNCVC